MGFVKTSLLNSKINIASSLIYMSSSKKNGQHKPFNQVLTMIEQVAHPCMHGAIYNFRSPSAKCDAPNIQTSPSSYAIHIED